MSKGRVFLPAGQQVTPVVRLSPRQRDVLKLLCEGKTNKAIAADLNMVVGTVNIHIRNLMKTLNARNRAQVVLMAMALLGRLR